MLKQYGKDTDWSNKKKGLYRKKLKITSAGGSTYREMWVIVSPSEPF
jgi:hypothetical protein